MQTFKKHIKDNWLFKLKREGMTTRLRPKRRLTSKMPLPVEDEPPLDPEPTEPPATEPEASWPSFVRPLAFSRGSWLSTKASSRRTCEAA